MFPNKQICAASTRYIPLHCLPLLYRIRYNQFAKPVQICIACYFCDSITVSCFEACEKRDFGWILERIGVKSSG